MTNSESGWLRKAARPGVAALRSHWAPFVFIQACAILLVLAYYRLEPVREWADQVAHAKAVFGLLFSALGGFIAGGIVPEIAKFATGKVKEQNWLGETVFNGCLYTFIAVQVDLFYRFQSWLFGDRVDIQTVFVKTAVDMAIYAPFLCIPSAILVCEWRALGWRAKGLGPCFSRSWYRERVFPALIPAWAFWIPYLSALYALPPNLQMPFALLGEAAWSLIFIFIATNDSTPMPGAS